VFRTDRVKLTMKSTTDSTTLKPLTYRRRSFSSIIHAGFLISFHAERRWSFWLATIPSVRVRAVSQLRLRSAAAATRQCFIRSQYPACRSAADGTVPPYLLPRGVVDWIERTNDKAGFSRRQFSPILDLLGTGISSAVKGGQITLRRHDTTCRQLPRNFPADLSATSLTSPRTCR